MDTYITPQDDAPDSTERAPDPPPRPRRFDERGIALQTVIIMVVLLAIAATVAGVLLSQAGRTTAELENQDITGATVDTAVECSATQMGGVSGDWDATTGCSWEESTPNDGTKVTAAQCRLAGGAYTKAASGVKAKCQGVKAS